MNFIQLNDGWNAEPNAPHSRVIVRDSGLTLEFDVNAFIYEGFKEGERARLVFGDCSRFRFGPTNDEGWYLGQCRFSKLAPDWGEFYEVVDDTLDDLMNDWRPLTGDGSRHFLFYLRDATFECKATSWHFERVRW